MSYIQQLDISELGSQSITEMGNLSSPPTTGYLFASDSGASVGSEQGGGLAEHLHFAFQNQSSVMAQVEQHERRWLSQWSTVECFQVPHRSDQREVRSIIATLKEAFAKQTSQVTEESWLSQNRARYAGEWIALSGDRLIAHSTSSADVIAAARAVHPRPLVIFIEPTDKPFAGW